MSKLLHQFILSGQLVEEGLIFLILQIIESLHFLAQRVVHKQFYMLYEFESALQLFDALSKMPAPEEHPFDYKYKARKVLMDLRPKLTEPLLLAILDYHIGTNFLDCEENGQANTYISQSLLQFAQIQNLENYLGYILAIYNHLGFLAINRDDNDIGLSILAKAEALGKELIQKPKISFPYKYLGGYESVENSHTITHFYIAQAYTKLGQKDKAAYYCGMTMQRQFASKTHELRDFCVNCISLAEYYSEKGQISQAYYLMQAAESLLPENKRKKLRATIQMATGKNVGEFMSFCIDKIKNGEQKDPALKEHINRQSINFEGIPVKFITFSVAQNYEEVKTLYRQANTQLKKALSYFVLDGYVTEHIQIQQETSNMLKKLVSLETDITSAISLFEKRAELLTPILEAINPKAYQNTHDKLLVEVAEINNELYELIYQHIHIDDFSVKNKKMGDKLNKAAQNTIKYYKKIIESLLNLQESEKDHAYYSSIITAYFNVAKALAKQFIKDKLAKVQSLVESLNTYKYVIKYINEQNKAEEFKNILVMAQEMVSLLPARIDRVNYS